MGASGYLLKDAPSAQLAEAIRRVAAGGRAVDPTLAAEAWTEPDPLTDRERQVLRLSDEGLSGDAIAGQLKLSEGTVRNYLSEAIGKLGARNRAEAARLARQKGCALGRVSCQEPRLPHPGSETERLHDDESGEIARIGLRMKLRSVGMTADLIN